MEIAKSVCAVYSVESMLYMTAGIMDLYPNTNIDVESSILKVMSEYNLTEITKT